MAKPKPLRYQLERVSGSQELEDLQNRLSPVLERISQDVDSSEEGAAAAATSSGTKYQATNKEEWGDDLPDSVEAALNALVARVFALENP